MSLEYHFGKFVNWYLSGTYFFDIHPPLGKLILTAAARFGGYGGTDTFSSIGAPLLDANIVYVRGAAAFAGALIVPITFITAAKLVQDPKV